MNELRIFDNKEFGKVRTFIEPDGTILYGASDIASALGYARPNDAVTAHCKGAVKRRIGVITGKKSDGTNAVQRLDLNFITEGDVYRLIVSSKLPSAERFERWLFDEVVPSIRKHGIYATPETLRKMLSEPDQVITILEILSREQEKNRELEARREALETQAAIDAPKVIFSDAVSTSKTTILVGELAKVLRQNGVEIGQNRLFERLRAEGYLMKCGSSYNMPTQKAMESGLFEIKETSIVHSDGHVTIQKTPKVTGRGQIYFVNKFLGADSKNTV